MEERTIAARKDPRQKADRGPRLNEAITAREMRVIGADGEQVGILTRDRALDMAEGAQLDLVEIAPESEPPVCRIMDYGKFRFEQKKKKQEARKKQKQTHIKEIKFRPGTDEGDYQVKLRNLTRLMMGTRPRSLCVFAAGNSPIKNWGWNCCNGSKRILRIWPLWSNVPKWRVVR